MSVAPPQPVAQGNTPRNAPVPTHAAAALGSEARTSIFWFTPKGELWGAIVAGVLLGIGFVLHVLLKLAWAEAFIWLSLTIGMVYGLRAAWDALSDKRVDIDVLMVVGAGLAALIGHPEEGALLLVLFTLSGALEELAMQRTEREVRALSALLPKEALVLRDGAWIEIDAEQLGVNELVRIRPGERVPVDAVVTEGTSSIDQSAITGESVPREVAVGDELFAGTVNADDPLTARTLRPARESSVQKILSLVISARDKREPMHRFIDRISQPYTITVLVVSVVIVLVWWLGFGVPLLGGGGGGGVAGESARQGALSTAITVLIVASPCALVIATPTATLAGLARLAKGGVLAKGGDALSRLAKVGAVCFDKTGTLTFGRPKLHEVHAVAWSNGDELLAIAAAMEQDSTHPIAQGILEAAAQRQVAPIALADVQHIVAKGIEARLPAHGNALVRIGRYSFVEELIPVCFRGRTQEVLARVQERGQIALVVARQDAAHPQGGEAAVLIMADAVRTGAQEMVQRLHAMGVRPLRMLTGDNRATAAQIGTALGLDQVDAELLPEDKLRIVREQREQTHRQHRGVAFIGDGINDAPALASADVALGIGTIGTAAALESSDVVLLNDNLASVPWALGVARRTSRTIVINLVVALGVIVVMSTLTLVASRTAHPIPLSLGVLAHEGGTVLVVLNSLRLLGLRGIPKASQTT
jgi:Zn2+/Cd2+-exporting ATPase